MIFIYLIVVYFLVVFIGLRLIVPNLGFVKKPVPNTLPEGLTETVEKLSKSSATNEDFLFKTYKYMTNKYEGDQVKTITRFWKAFQNPFSHSEGFMHCTNQNYILRAMLIKSGRFTENDIKLKITMHRLFIHQYMTVRVDSCTMRVDPWSHFLGKGMKQIS